MNYISVKLLNDRAMHLLVYRATQDLVIQFIINLICLSLPDCLNIGLGGSFMVITYNNAWWCKIDI